MIQVIVGASAQTSEPRPKTKVPRQKVVRAPNEAVSRPVQVAATIDEARNAVVGQCISAAPPSSPTMVGRTVASSSTFIEWSRMPPASTASGGSHSGFRSDCQPSIMSSPLVIQRDYATSSVLEVKRNASDEAMLRALALGELRHRLLEDKALEVLGLRMLGERRLVAEHLVEEELRRLGRRLVDLESQHAGLGLGLRQEFLDDADQRVDLAGLGFPESGDDE